MASRITFYASVSFEYDIQPVQTYEGEIIAANASLAARRALEGARRAYPRSSPRSYVVVLEERSRTAAPARAAQPAA